MFGFLVVGEQDMLSRNHTPEGQRGSAVLRWTLHAECEQTRQLCALPKPLSFLL